MSKDSAEDNLPDPWRGHTEETSHRGSEEECGAGVERGMATEDEKVPEEVEEILPRGVRRGGGRRREISLVYFPTLMKVSPG